ncbi:hypothetical protein PUN28_019129 [Cardiocondyla obscurior]|uniref:RRM domain-containing protein n=1 Tax=Cardiocondyla obscurior TaxID=286306 RepID=A0AAW2EEG4_9HYME
MDSKSKENRKGNRKRGGRKDDKSRRKNPKNEDSVWLQVVDDENHVERDASLDRENFDNGSDKASVKTYMSPVLDRKLETHRNVLRLLYEQQLISTQINGQRILSIQPVRWSGPIPGIECEIFVGRIPKTIFEDTLYPLFKTVGEIFQIRLMVDMAELTRGYCFIMYTNQENAARAIVQLDEHEIIPGRKIRVLASINKCKLYVGPLPWNIQSEEVVRVIYASAWDIEYVSIYRLSNHNAAYAIIFFKSHRNAALARRKLRPERLFKCNETHVEWARVDWNPSNMYEDRGMVDDKGNVQITRKFLEPKKIVPHTSAPPTTQNISKSENRKQLSPICPPSGGGNWIGNKSVSNSTSNGHHPTRYSTMLALSAMDVLSDDKSRTMLTEINNNVQPSNGNCHFQDKMWKKDAANSFPDFDMWKSNLVPALPDLVPTLPKSFSDKSKGYDDIPSLSKGIKKLWHNLENDVMYPSQYPLLNGCQYSNNLDVSSRQSSFSTGKAIDRIQPIIPAYHQNYPACYVLVKHPVYLCSKDAVIYPQSSFVAHHAHENYNCQSYKYPEQTGVQGSVAIDSSAVQINKKFDDYDIWRDGIATRAGNSEAIPFPVSSTVPCRVQNCSSNLVFNFAPFSRPEENATSCCVPFDVAKNEKSRFRPILKQELARTQL